MSLYFRSGFLIAVVTASIAFPAFAAGKKDTALANQVIKQLESSGALDDALDRAVERKIKRDVDQRKKLAEEAQKKRSELTRNARKVDPGRDQIFGSPTAKLSVIAYSDLECPFCKRFAGVPEKAAAGFGDKVNVVWRHYPLDIHGLNARKEAYAAECVAKQAGSESFFKFVNDLLDATESNGKGHPNGDAGLVELAKQAGMKDEPAFAACLADPAMAQRVDEDMKDGIEAGIEGTPGVILRDNATGRSEFVGGAIPQAALEERIQKLLSSEAG